MLSEDLAAVANAVIETFLSCANGAITMQKHECAFDLCGTVSLGPFALIGGLPARSANCYEVQEDLKGLSPMPNTATARIRLAEQLAELEARQDRIVQDLAEPLNADSSEQAVEMQDDIPLESQAALVAREIASVNRALLRIENGTYGECVRCGDAIDSKRLEVRPEAALCFACASKEQ